MSKIRFLLPLQLQCVWDLAYKRSVMASLLRSSGRACAPQHDPAPPPPSQPHLTQWSCLGGTLGGPLCCCHNNKAPWRPTQTAGAGSGAGAFALLGELSWPPGFWPPIVISLSERSDMVLEVTALNDSARGFRVSTSGCLSCLSPVSSLIYAPLRRTHGCGASCFAASCA